ncbi:hypothetical protein FWH13_03460 [Candidatus Saccharibacteria bacterium]|nr:hypothetical protein [Candidatus Saccharibacteria bacterium]
MNKGTYIDGSKAVALLRRLSLTRFLVAVVAISAFTLLTAVVVSKFAPASASPESAAANIIEASIDYILTMTLGAADATSDCSMAAGGNINIPISAPNGDTYFACLNANVDTSSNWGYSLTMATDTASLIGDPAGQISATTGTIASPTQLNDNAWGFCIPSERMTNVPNGFASGLTTACGGWNGSTPAALLYAAVPVSTTRIRDVDTLPNTTALQNTPIRFGVRPTATLAIGTYSTSITISASANAPPASFMQDFTTEACSAMAIGDIITLADARDGKPYRVRKMPDDKCWMLDNLAYTGGGGNNYGDVVAVGSGVGSLQEVTESSSWGGNTTRRFANNSTASLTLNSGTTCTTSITGTGVMQSICGDQILYNFCAALGLDSSTTPTCAAVTNTTTGTNMAATGVVGATGGVGGESLGSGGTSICPAGWRIPRGRDSSSGFNVETNNEWAILSGSFNAGALSSANVATGAGFMGYWQPVGTSVGAGGIQLGGGAFGTVAAGSVGATGNLANQSATAVWWTPSLSSGTSVWRTLVTNSSINPGTNSAGKANGFSVRCMLDAPLPEPEPVLPMQEFTPAECDSMAAGDVVTLADARDGKEYRVRKMPDNKCWMYDNLAYTGGGDNQYNDAVAIDTTGVGGLREVTVNTDWDNPAGVNNGTRRFVNNSTASLTLSGGTACLPDTATGTGVMQSICGDQILYNFCAALGLDTNTTPTCASVSNTTTGTGMSSAGTVGAASGLGGESLGSGGSSICPTGWRIPRGRDNSTGTNDDTNNEWAVLSGSFLNNTLSAADTTNTAASQAPWQPAGTAATLPQWNAAFGTVSAGNVTTAGNLFNQSTVAFWWTSSLNSDTRAWNNWVHGMHVSPGTDNGSKALGFSVRCVLDTSPQKPEQPPMQAFTSSMCSDMTVGDITTLTDARDNKEYRVRKMPDNKCWMMDNLAYTGGGNNQYNDVVDVNATGVGGLREITASDDWNVSLGVNDTARRFANNSNLSGTTTTCSPTAVSGTDVMQSTCGNQILYNWCAALGLDSSTTPTCAAVSSSTTGTNMSSAGTVGAAGGVGGESLGSGGSSICPAGWRIPRGRDISSGANDINNEWAILNGSFLNNTLSAADTTSTTASQAPWQPAGTAATFSQWNGAFGTVSAGFVDMTGSLGNQSTDADWWTSSLFSATYVYRAGVGSTYVGPGTYINHKAVGFSVRCVFP